MTENKSYIMDIRSFFMGKKENNIKSNSVNLESKIEVNKCEKCKMDELYYSKIDSLYEIKCKISDLEYIKKTDSIMKLYKKNQENKCNCKKKQLYYLLDHYISNYRLEPRNFSQEHINRPLKDTDLDLPYPLDQLETANEIIYSIPSLKKIQDEHFIVVSKKFPDFQASELFSYYDAVYMFMNNICSYPDTKKLYEEDVGRWLYDQKD